MILLGFAFIAFWGFVGFSVLRWLWYGGSAAKQRARYGYIIHSHPQRRDGT